ncbi:unnamed protein product, partial [Mesorhabditis belari]|uniref:C-mannosyltransferase DPY19L1 n=1 Tax=Mesorhabditis belari TaxID=2138241 RepID=A0AAF3J1B9_9BILA
MAYRTEMGLYFSYYKTLITAPSFLTGLAQITSDNVTEYGHTINTLKRFNLYPEVTLGFLYRQFRAFAGVMRWQVETCWQIGRGEGWSPVQSCAGIGNSHYFYIIGVFAIAGTVAGSLFLLGTLLSDSMMGGLLSVIFFAFNHGESTRVQWTPPLRESFSYPIILFLMVLVTYILKTRKSGRKWMIGMVCCAVPALLSWQFAQFSFFTQICALFATHVLDYAPIETMKTLAFGHLISFGISFIFLFGNEMLLTSLYFSSILTFLILLLLDDVLQRVSFRPIYILLEVLIFIAGTLLIKQAISTLLNVEDDAHIFDILKSKFTDFASFHTRLYTCAAEFDFLQKEALWKLSYSLLIPVGHLIPFDQLCKIPFTEPILWRNLEMRTGKTPELLYNSVQLLSAGCMALLIMRLKLFFTPHLAACAAMILNEKIISSIIHRPYGGNVRLAVFGAVVAAAAYQGIPAIRQQLSIIGEYMNPEQELLFNWINEQTPKNAVFGGTMPVMANVKLSTLRPITNHPHYEDVGIRERTLKVYSMFSKKPLREVYKTLKAMKIDYFVFQIMNCAPHHARAECSYRSMWDLHDPSNARRESLCDVWERLLNGHPEDISPFKMVYNQNGYTVFQI